MQEPEAGEKKLKLRSEPAYAKAFKYWKQKIKKAQIVTIFFNIYQ